MVTLQVDREKFGFESLAGRDQRGAPLSWRRLGKGRKKKRVRSAFVKLGGRLPTNYRIAGLGKRSEAHRKVLFHNKPPKKKKRGQLGRSRNTEEGKKKERWITPEPAGKKWRHSKKGVREICGEKVGPR